MLGSEVCSRSTVREEDPLDRIRFELKPEGRESMRSVQVRKKCFVGRVQRTRTAWETSKGHCIWGRR